MEKEVKCLSCGHVFFRIGPLNEKGESWGILAEDQSRYASIHKRQDEKDYYECPQCKKRNWIASVATPGKGQKTWISHVTE